MQRLHRHGFRRLRLAQTIQHESTHHSITQYTIHIPSKHDIQPSNQSYVRPYSSHRSVKSIGEKMLELTEAGRYVECLSLYDRVLKQQSEITEIAAYNVIRSNLARNSKSVGDVFLDLIARCPAISTAAIFNLMLESLAMENEMGQNDQSNKQSTSHSTSESLKYPAQEIAMLLELMESHQVQPDHITHLHLAHISYQHNRMKDATAHFTQFMQKRDEYVKDQLINHSEYSGVPPSKMVRGAGYVALIRILIHCRQTDFASYLMNELAALKLAKPWMYGQIEKLKLAKKHAQLMNNKKPLKTSNGPQSTHQSINQSVDQSVNPPPKQSNKISSPNCPNSSSWIQSPKSTDVPEVHLNIPHVISIDHILMDEPSTDQLINGHSDEFRAIYDSEPVDDHHTQLLIYYQQHDLDNAINQLQHGWSVGVSFQSAYYDLIILMLCTTPSNRSVREKMDLIIQVIDQSTNQHQELSLVATMLTLRSLAQFEMPLPVHVNTSSYETDRLDVLNIARHCETLFYHCMSKLQSNNHSNNPDDPCVPLLRELYLRSQVKHPECGETAHLSINLDSDDQSLVSSLTPNSFVCLIYAQILAPRRSIKEAYHLFASLTSCHARVPEAAFYYLSMGEVIRHNASKSSLIYLRAMQQRYLDVSDYFHYAIADAFSVNEKYSENKNLLEAQTRFLVELNAMIKTKPLKLNSSVTRLILIGGNLALSGGHKVRLDHLIDYCLDSILSRSSDHTHNRSNDQQVTPVHVTMSLIVFALHNAHVSHSRTIKLRQLIKQTIDNISLLDYNDQEKQLVQLLNVHSRLETSVNLNFSAILPTLGQSSNQPSNQSSTQSTNQSPEQPVDQPIDRKSSYASTAATRIHILSTTLKDLPSELRIPFLIRCFESLLTHSLTLGSIYMMRGLPKEIVSLLSSSLIERQVDHDPFLLAYLASFHVLIRSNDTPTFIELALRSVAQTRDVHLNLKHDRSVNELVRAFLGPNMLSTIDFDQMEHRLKLINLVYQSLLLTSEQRTALFGVPDPIIPDDDDSILAALHSPCENDKTDLPVSIALHDFLVSMKAGHEVDYNTLRLFVEWSSTLQVAQWVHQALDLIHHNVPVNVSEVEGRLKFYRDLSTLAERGRVHVIWSKMVQSFLVFLPQACRVINKNHKALLKDVVDTYYILFCASARYCVRFNQWAQLNAMSSFPRCVDADECVVKLPSDMVALMLVTRMKAALMKGKVRRFRQAVRDTASWGYLVLIDVRSAHPSQVPLPCMEKQDFLSAAELVQQMVESINPLSSDVMKFDLFYTGTTTMRHSRTLEKILPRLSPNSALRQSLRSIDMALSDPSMLDDVNLPFIVGMVGELCDVHYKDVRTILKNPTSPPPSTSESDSDDVVLIDEAILIEALADAIAYRAFMLIHAKCILRANDPQNDFYGTALHPLPKKHTAVQRFMFQTLSSSRQNGLIDIANATLASTT